MRGPRFLTQTQNTYFGQKVRPLNLYLGRYCFTLNYTIKNNPFVKKNCIISKNL